MKTTKFFGLTLAFGVAAVTLLAQNNDCVDSVSYDPWTCSVQGTVATVGVLNTTSLNVCLGGTLSAPTFTTNPTFNNGTKNSFEHHPPCYSLRTIL